VEGKMKKRILINTKVGVLTIIFLFLFIFTQNFSGKLMACAPWQDETNIFSRWYGCTATSTWFDLLPSSYSQRFTEEFHGFENAVQFHDYISNNPPKEPSTTNGPPEKQVIRRFYRVVEDDFPANDITAVAEDYTGAVYVGTQKHGLIILDPSGEQWVSFTSSELTFPAIHDLRFSVDRKLWIGTMAGLYSLDMSGYKDGWEHFFSEGISTSEILSSLIVATDGLEIYRMENGVIENCNFSGNLWEIHFYTKI